MMNLIQKGDYKVGFGNAVVGQKNTAKDKKNVER